MARVADELALEEGDVDDGGVEVDELEDEHFERQVVVKVGLRAVHLWIEKHHVLDIAVRNTLWNHSNYVFHACNEYFSSGTRIIVFNLACDHIVGAPLIEEFSSLVRARITVFSRELSF